MVNEARILLIDVETSPLTIYAWGVHEVNAIKVVKPWHLLCFAYQWLGEKTQFHANIDFGDPLDDKPLCKILHGLLNEADILIAQNGDAFDVKKINTRLLIHGFSPPSPYKTVDTLKVARSYFAFSSNRLDDLGKDLSEGEKIKHRGFDMWEGCMAGKEKDWLDMRRYNIGDITLLKKIYLRERPWIKNHPSLSVYEPLLACPKCGSDRLQSRGTQFNQTMQYNRFQCLNCGGWTRSNKGKKATGASNA